MTMKNGPMVGKCRLSNMHKSFGCVGINGGNITVPSTDQAKQWQGFGTALKPAIEPIVLARKPVEGTVAENV